MYLEANGTQCHGEQYPPGPMQGRMLIMLTVGCTMSQLSGCVKEGGSHFSGSTLG
jgi:hypothetical protein